MIRAIDGLLAFASLDGAPAAASDLAALGLRPGPDGCAIGVRDRGTTVTIAEPRAFLGHLDGPGSDVPPVDRVASAIDRHGDAAAAGLLGEWSWIGWDASAATLTLVASDTMRDPLFYATDGRRVAVAPDLSTLKRLSWVDATPGPGLLAHLGRGPLRSRLGDRTMLRGVRWTGAGTRVRIGRAGVSVGVRPPLPEPIRWRGSFAEAVEELDALLRRIVGEELARHPDAAVLLSGGLDSSLIAAFAAEAGAAPPALTSVAPPGSGLTDDLPHARAVADRLGMALYPVVPDDADDAYRPAPGLHFALDRPPCSPRHYVYEALYRAAAAIGADAVFDGCDGEWTLTAWPERRGWRHRLRAATARVRARPRGSDALWGTVADAFHVRLGTDALALARAELGEELRAPPPCESPHRPDDPWGYSPAILRTLRQTAATHRAGLRQLAPFRDRRLVTLFAGMPYRFLVEGGLTRAPARALLAGRVPEQVRLRARGAPFSPDYGDRLRRQAAGARARLCDQTATMAGEWLDLGWLDGALARIGAGATVSPDTLVGAQMTACIAAFLAEWP